MSRILVFQHVAHEPLGILHALLKKAGFRIRFVNFAREKDQKLSISGYDGLVVLGGPMGVYETAAYPNLEVEMACIREAVAADKPVLGICLGAQLIAAALGAAVSRGQQQEIGWYDVSLTAAGKTDPVLGEMQATEKIFQWHGDFFQLPEGAVWLAQSAACPFQAFRFGTKVYGLQFHLEVDEKMIERWLTTPANAHEFVGAAGDQLRATIRAQTPQYIAHSQALSRRLFMRYINLCHNRSRLRWSL